MVIDGIKFPSKAESLLYLLLKERGIIFQCQPKVYLTRAKILFKPDFSEITRAVYYEMKGVETPSWRIKRRLWMYYGPGKLEVYKMKNGKPYLFETITPCEAFDGSDTP